MAIVRGPKDVALYGTASLVTVRRNKYQHCIVFSSALVKKADVLSKGRAIIAWDDSNKKLGFVFTDEKYYGENYTFPVHKDGKATSRAISVSSKYLPFLGVGKYEPIIGDDSHIEGGDGSHVTVTIAL